MSNSSSEYAWIWNEDWWFPQSWYGEKYGWKDLENTDESGIYLPKIEDLSAAVILGLGFVTIRIILERFVIIPIGYILGIRKRDTSKLAPHAALEEFYRNNNVYDNVAFEKLSKRLDMTTRNIERWIRVRRKWDSPAPIKKFCDNCWHLLFYSVAFCYGVCVLWDKPWLWKTYECWRGWPKQHVPNSIYWYYLVELGFYWSLVFTLFTDHKRKDFKENIIHHIATIVLLYFSWVVNYVRIGTLILVAHDAADPFLGMSKFWKYLRREDVAVPCFVAFTIVWILSRLIYFPFWVLYSTTYEGFGIADYSPWFVFIFINVLLYTLMVLHIFWTYSIYRIVHSVVWKTKIQDVRSDTDDDDDL